METLTYLIEEIVITKKLNISMNELFTGRRLKSIISARHIVWYFLHKERDIKLHDISYRYAKDHSSVFHGIQSVIDQMVCYPRYRNNILEIKRLIS